MSDKEKRVRRRAADRAARRERQQPPVIELPAARIKVKIKNEEKP